jgi:hypothetical protein
MTRLAASVTERGEVLSDALQEQGFQTEGRLNWQIYEIDVYRSRSGRQAKPIAHLNVIADGRILFTGHGDVAAAIRRAGLSKFLVITVEPSMVVAVIADGYVYGGSSDAGATNPRYWLSLRQDHEPHSLYLAKNVPSDIAQAIEDMGSPDQEYRDGYEAMRAIDPYMDKEPFYESPEEWIAERAAEDE